MSDGNGNLPQGWTMAKADDLRHPNAPIIYGILQPGPDQEEGVYYVRPTEIVEDVIQVSHLRKTTREIAERYKRASLNGGDILLSIVGTIGKVATVPTELQGANITQSSVRIRTNAECVEAAFVRHVLKAPPVTQQFDKHRLGTGVPRLNVGHVRELSIPLAPLPEQQRIVSKIESLQERSGRARRALAEVGPLLEQFRQSVLRAAFSGRLTADWRAANPDVEPASQLLQRIRTERRQKWEQAELAKYEAKGKKPPKDWRDKYEQAESIDESKLEKLPTGWCWVRLPELGYMNRGKSRHRPRNAEHLYGGPYPFVQTGDIAQSRGCIKGHKQTYSEEGLSQSRLWPEGTVCITIAANIASSAVLSYPACFPDSVVGVVPDNAICSPEFVEFFIRTAKEDLERFAPSTAQKNINLGTLTELAVPLPPPDESAALVRRIKDGLEMADRIGGAVVESESDLNQLDQSFLAKAFRGELVPQDPSDEPASALLARIRAERESNPAKSRKKKR